MTATPKARPTIYKGIQMRSRLEASYAAWLDKFALTWEYEPHAFADETGQYLPDFRLQDVNLLGVGTVANLYIEVKPSGWPKPEQTRDLDRVNQGKNIILTSAALGQSMFLLVLPERNCLFMDTKLTPVHAHWVVDYREGDPCQLSLGVDPGGSPWHEHWKAL